MGRPDVACAEDQCHRDAEEREPDQCDRQEPWQQLDPMSRIANQSVKPRGVLQNEFDEGQRSVSDRSVIIRATFSGERRLR